MKRALVLMTAGALLLGTGAFPARAQAPAVPSGCTGGVAPNPSVEEGSPPAGYTFNPAAPVPAGTPKSEQPRLSTAGGYQQDGGKYALIATPDKLVSTAYAALKFVPGAVYTLTDWTGTNDGNLRRADAVQETGLRFYNAANKVVLENKRKVEHAVEADGKLARQDFPPSTAPPTATSVKFFAATDRNWVMWDCVHLRVASLSVKAEVRDPASGAWGGTATIEAGTTANFRFTLTNDGTEALTGIKVDDPYCDVKPAPIASLDGGKSTTITCDHANVTEADNGRVGTVTVSGAKHSGGTLPKKTATTTIKVTPPPAIDEIGEFVWTDLDRNGLQDAGEPGVAGVKVTLKDASGTALGTLTTDAAGKYRFAKLKDGIYQVCFDIGALPPEFAGHAFTAKDAGDDAKDSDADPANGCTATTTVGPKKRQDLTLAAGLVAPVNKLGDFVWLDKDKDGLQSRDEIGVPEVKVTLKDASAKVVGEVVTGPDGRYAFEGVPAGSYQVCFDAGSRQLTRSAAAQYNGTDSAADPATGCTPVTESGAPEDLTRDAGLIEP
nr:SdrD B-like domain-containing protein [Amycolatopsis regifaucium]